MNHLPITKWSRERTDQCLEEKEGEGAEIEELEPGNGQQAGKRLGRLLRTIWLELELTVTWWVSGPESTVSRVMR